MKVANILLLTVLISACYTLDCNVATEDKLDCGYMGINQSQCEGRGCCWVPVNNSEAFARFLQTGDNIPWCFYSEDSNFCQKWNLQSDSAGFDNWYQGMLKNFMEQIDIDGKGGVEASPDDHTPGGSYVYHWMRDAALTMRTYMELNDYDVSTIEGKMSSYMSWVQNVQHENDPNHINVLIEPKFDLPDGQPYTGGWCRPQTDGPGLRSGTLIKYAEALIKAGKQSIVTSQLWTSNNDGLIQTDINWILNNWQSNGCDLWEEVKSTDFFWNRMAFYQTLTWASQLASKLGDSGMASKCSATANQIKPTLLEHWNGSYIYESTNRLKDSAVVHALVTLNENVFDITGTETASTIKTFNKLFCAMFPLNQADDVANIPGILYGRYEGDTYAGGNPWQLLTAALAEAFYKGAALMVERGDEILDESEVKHWRDLYELSEKPTAREFAAAAKSAGNAVMYRMWQHVSYDPYNLSEQMDKVDGANVSAYRLTWSYANVLRVMHNYVNDGSVLDGL